MPTVFAFASTSGLTGTRAKKVERVRSTLLAGNASYLLAQWFERKESGRMGITIEEAKRIQRELRRRGNRGFEWDADVKPVREKPVRRNKWIYLG